MKVILNKDVKKLGKKHDVINVNEGYARNYLLPNNIAKLLDNKSINEAEGKINSNEFKKKQEIDKANRVKEQIENEELIFKIKVGSNGKLFGSVNEKTICEKINQKYDLKLDKRKVNLSRSVKKVGEYIVNIKLLSGIIAKVNIKVEGEK